MKDHKETSVMGKNAISCETCRFECGYSCRCSECKLHNLWEPKRLEDEEFELQGLCAGCKNNDETCSLCPHCRDASNFEPKKRDESVGANQNNDASTERGEILRKALEIINGERQDLYGKPEDSFQLIAEYWNSFLERKLGIVLSEHGLDMLDKRSVAEMMMLFKIARMSGQKPSLDNYLDIAGYAGIAADFAKKEI